MKKIERVKALPQFGLLIVFQNGVEKNIILDSYIQYILNLKS